MFLLNNKLYFSYCSPIKKIRKKGWDVEAVWAVWVPCNCPPLRCHKLAITFSSHANNKVLSIFVFKNILKRFNLIYLFYFKLICFSVFKLFWYTIIINNFLKLKKYYFNIFLNKKYFKKQLQLLFKNKLH